MVKKLFEKVFPKKLPKGVEDLKTNAYINPLCEVEVNFPGRSDLQFRQPFLLIMSAYLKEHGWQPEDFLNPPPEVIFRMAKGSEIKFPLYIQKKPEDGFQTKLTPEEAIKKGYIIPQAAIPKTIK